MYRLYLGSQILAVFLGWDESVSMCSLSVLPTSAQKDHCLTSRVYRQPILADEVQTFKALITVHKVLQEGHPVAVKEAQTNIHWLESLMRGLVGDGLRGRAQRLVPAGGFEMADVIKVMDHSYEIMYTFSWPS